MSVFELVKTMCFKHDVTNIDNDVLTSTSLCKHMTLLQRR